MTKPAEQIIREAVEEFKRQDADFAGSLMKLSVQGVSSAGITLHDLRRVILDNPILPNDWAPEPQSDLTMYLSTMSELGRSTNLEGKFLPDDSGEYEFSPSRHHQYIVKRMFLSSAERNPTAHKVIHMEKEEIPKTDKNGNIIGKQIKNVEADDGIQIFLWRKDGDISTDTTGGTVWTSSVYNNDGTKVNWGCDIRYWPFLRTLKANFKKKCRAEYDNKEIRDTIQDILWKGLGVQPVARGGLYYTDPENYAKLSVLSDELRDLNGGIALYHWGVPVYADGSRRNGLQEMVSDGLMSHLNQEMADLIGNLEEMGAADGTRHSTWRRRKDELKEMRTKIQKLAKVKLLNEENLKKQFEKAVDLIKSGLQDTV